MNRIEAYSRLAIIFIIIITILYLPVLLSLRKKRKSIIRTIWKVWFVLFNVSYYICNYYEIFALSNRLFKNKKWWRKLLNY